MQPSRRPCIYASLAVLWCTLLAPRTHAENLTITSDPPGATVEIDGLVTGKTPYQTNLPGGYFHKTHTAFNARLEHALVARVSKDGYVAQQLTLTDGPFEWVAVTGRRHGNYFLLKSEHFNVKLQERGRDEELSLDAPGKAGPMRAAAGEPAHGAEIKTATRGGTVTVSSDLAGAEIYLDGKFVGQTPSTLSMGAGTHHIEVKAEGKRSWERDLEVLGESQVTLRASFGEEQ
jgi:PEGA domain-containing protein